MSLWTGKGNARGPDLRKLFGNNRLVAKVGLPRPAIGFVDVDAEQPLLSRLAPHLARHHTVLFPLGVVRNDFRLAEFLHGLAKKTGVQEQRSRVLTCGFTDDWRSVEGIRIAIFTRQSTTLSNRGPRTVQQQLRNLIAV